ncbi:MAG: hypothetical protein KJ061_19760, partial [Vicinamibacteraceae bacterium]|nr:hypothetical protein [Vicinamibacteraceae bacterium]
MWKKVHTAQANVAFAASFPSRVDRRCCLRYWRRAQWRFEDDGVLAGARVAQALACSEAISGPFLRGSKGAVIACKTDVGARLPEGVMMRVRAIHT